MNKNTRIRYYLARKILKILTPSFFQKLEELECLGYIYGYNNEKIIKTPRPTTLRIKEKLDGKELNGVEIGVMRGHNSESLLKELNIETLYLIDPYENYQNIDRLWHKSKNHLAYVLHLFKNNPKVKLVIDYSEKVAKYFKDESLDFVYIDGNHKYKFVKQDLELYYPKVKRGGIIGGHDILNCRDVLPAVRDFCIENKIQFEIIFPDWVIYK